ncbi:MAG: CPBP family intramembrane metalloprotease [Acholeplasmatales bacterium]|nr:CPBP family intramembrane metalloprotease [Acholeplasmatales bacterium]
MENNIDNKQNKNRKLNIYLTLIFYAAIMLFVGAIIIYISVFLASNINDLDNEFMLKAVTDESTLIKGTKEYDVFYTTYAIGQGFTYLLLFIVCIIFMRSFLKEDFEKTKEKYLFYIIYIIVSIAVFLLTTILVSTIVGKFVGDSENQALVERLIESDGKFAMIIATVIFAPICEELVFRKAVFELTKKFHKVVPYVISISTFTLIHMVSSDISNFGDWVLMAIPYFVSASLFCVIYDMSKQNIYTSISAHVANNLLAAILIFV